MIQRGQDPFIADKMEERMQEAGFDIVGCIKKDTFPGKMMHHFIISDTDTFYIGKPDQLNREFLWDLRNIFKSGQAFLAEQLQISDEKYPAFLDQFVVGLQQDPPARWSLVFTTGRKPF